MPDLSDAARAFAIVAGLEFKPEGHEYHHNGRRLPSVTRILEAANLVDLDGIPPERLAYKRSLGTAVHAAILYLLDDDLDTEKLHPDCAPYLAAFERFRTETAFRPARELCEQPLADPALGFAGTPDLPGEFPTGTAVVEVKCVYTMSPAYGPQLAAYRHLLKAAAGFTAAERIGLQLCPDATYKLVHYDRKPEHRRDWPAFQHALGLFHWRTQHGLV